MAKPRVPSAWGLVGLARRRRRHALAGFDDSAELNRIVAENPFTPYMDVEIMPVVEPSTAMATYGEVVAALATSD